MADAETEDQSEADPTPSRDPIRPGTWLRSPWLCLVVVGGVLALVVAVTVMRSPKESGPTADPVVSPTTLRPSPIPPDLDGDGLGNDVERDGWHTKAGAVYRTDPRNADTDGDGLTDGQEAGDLLPTAATPRLYAGYANPLKADSDGDRLRDADEADSSTRPLDRDSDDDGLSDFREVRVVGTSPVVADTDGDGFKDGFEVRFAKSRGLDPQLAEVKVSKMAYAIDFGTGAILGDARRKDSLAWLMGNLAAGGSSFLPGFGWIIGTAADVRDLAFSAMRGDWVGSSTSAIGVVPVIGDSTAIPAKAAKFVAHNPVLATPVAAAIVKLPKISEEIKFKTLKAVQPGSQTVLKAGANKAAVLRLSRGNTNLDHLAASVKRPGNVRGVRTPFFTDWKAAEDFLERDLRRRSKHVATQVSVSTATCVEVCNRVARTFDVVSNGVAHESKMGFKTLTEEMAKQIRSDAFLVKSGQIRGAHWHFYASAHTNKVGAEEQLLDYLDKFGIPYTIHMPRA